MKQPCSGVRAHVLRTYVSSTFERTYLPTLYLMREITQPTCLLREQAPVQASTFLMIALALVFLEFARNRAGRQPRSTDIPSLPHKYESPTKPSTLQEKCWNARRSQMVPVATSHMHVPLGVPVAASSVPDCFFCLTQGTWRCCSASG